MTTWLTSDQHFEHANIIKYTNRPFTDVQHMNNYLVAEWNSMVAPDDIVYQLGDFTLGNLETARYMFSLLNGRIHVLGNHWHHDSRWLITQIRDGASSLHSAQDHTVIIDLPVVVLENVENGYAGWSTPAILCHYPFLNWDRMHYGSYHFFGHSHGASEKRPNCLDVGVDNIYKLTGRYRPVSLEEAIKFAKNS